MYVVFQFPFEAIDQEWFRDKKLSDIMPSDWEAMKLWGEFIPNFVTSTPLGVILIRFQEESIETMDRKEN